MRPRGFTLMEVVISIALLVLLASIMLPFARRIAERRLDLGAQLDGQDRLALVLDSLDRALTTAVAVGAGGEAGLTGTDRRLAIVCRVARPASDDAGEAAGDAARFAIALSEGVLLADRGEGWEAVVEGLGQVRFTYLKGSVWEQSWDSARDGLPLAVRLEAWMSPPPGRDASEGGEGESEDLLAVEPYEEEAPPSLLRVFALLDPAVPTDSGDVWSGEERLP